MACPWWKGARDSQIAQEPVSLEMPIGEEEDSHLGDFIADDNTPPRRTPPSLSAARAAFEVLAHLTPREESVLAALRTGGRPSPHARGGRQGV